MSRLEELSSEYIKSINVFYKGEENNQESMEKVINGWSNYLGIPQNEFIYYSSETYPSLKQVDSIKEAITFKEDGFWHVPVGFNLDLPINDGIKGTVIIEFLIKEDEDQYIVKLENCILPFEVNSIDELELDQFYEHVYDKCMEKIKQHVNSVKGNVFDSNNQLIFV